MLDILENNFGTSCLLSNSTAVERGCHKKSTAAEGNRKRETGPMIESSRDIFTNGDKPVNGFSNMFSTKRQVVPRMT
jgi:hypothetical protein